MSIHFREQAKKELFSREELEMPVKRGLGVWYLVLAGSILLVLAGILWIFCARLPVTVSGKGVYLEEKQKILCFISAEEADSLDSGMEVWVKTPGKGNNVSQGTISSIESLWMTEEDILELLKGNELFFHKLTDDEPAAIFWCSLEAGQGNFRDGTLLDISVLNKSVSPISLWQEDI